MKRKLIAMINDCQQYSPDGFEDKPVIIDLDENTTIRDLIKFHDKKFAIKKSKYNKETKKIDEWEELPDIFRMIHILEKTEL